MFPTEMTPVWLNWFIACYLSVPALDGFVLAIKYIHCPLVVVFQWGAHCQLPEPVSIHVRYLGQR